MAKPRKTTPPASNRPPKNEARTGLQLRNIASSPWFVAAFLGAVIGVIYGPAMRAPQIFDDYNGIISNESIFSLWPLVGDAERPGPLNPSKYLPTSARPLVNLSLALNYAAGAAQPAGYRCVNVALHFLCAMLLWAIVRRTLRLNYFNGEFDAVADWLAAAVALVWAVHPLASETVVYITQRTELMMALFYLAALYCSLRYWAALSPARRRAWLVTAILACAAGMLCKEVMVSAPLVVLLFERTFVARSLSGALRRSWPLYMGLVGTWVLLVLLNMGSPHSDAAGFGQNVSLLAWWFTQAKVFLIYLKLALVPWPLAIHYELDYLTLGNTWPYLLIVSVLGMITLVLLWQNRPAGFLLTCVFVILSPTSIVPIITEIAAERRMYLPLTALVVLAVFGGLTLARELRRRVGRNEDSALNARAAWLWIGLPIVIVAMVFGAVTSSRAYVYNNPLKLWLNLVELQPNNALARCNVGAELQRIGRTQDAVPWHRQAVQMKPDYAQFRYLLGLVLLRTNQPEEAIAEFREAARLLPSVAEYQSNLGVGLFSAGLYKESIPLFRKALKLDPRMWRAHDNLGMALYGSGDLPGAIENYQAALEINPRALDVYSHLAEAYARNKQAAAAIAAAQKALEIARAAGRDDIAQKIGTQIERFQAAQAAGLAD
jgi:protein O-mannosyl-transferase